MPSVSNSIATCASAQTSRSRHGFAVSRILPLLSMSLLIALVCTSVASAAGTVKGKVLKAGDAKITITAKDNEELTFEVSESAKVKRNGKDASLADIEEGDAVELTTAKKSTKTVVTVITARSEE